MDIVGSIQNWGYPIIDLFLLIYCLGRAGKQGAKFFAIGFGILFTTSLMWRVVDIFDLYMEYGQIYEILGPVNLLGYIVFAGLVATGVSRSSNLANTQKEGSMEGGSEKMSTSQILFSLEGRINRAKFWGYMLLLSPIWILGLIIDLSTTGQYGAFYFIGALICLWPAIALNVKRCHDRDKSGWFYLICLIPFVNLWYTVEIGFLKGTDGDNRYGPDPLK